jgi:hypothetical protein
MPNPDPELVLKQFELSKGDGGHVFGGECVKVASEIETNYRNSTYDHRPFLPNFEPDSPFYLEQYRIGYACFKREVAKVLKPKIIVEIGIGVGIGALAMMDGSPQSSYFGIDNDEADFPVSPQIKPTQFVSGWMDAKSYIFQIVTNDSQAMDKIPFCDLVHVDGDHRRESARHDVVLAWQSEAKWILCDDARDAEVVSGIFEALALDLKRGSVDWAYFGDTWTGSILIRTDHRKG